MWHQSLRFRLLIPLLGVSIMGAGLTMVLSISLGRLWAEREVSRRVESIRASLSASTYPLTANVLASLSKLTGAHLVVFRAGQIQAGSIQLYDTDVAELNRLSQLDQASRQTALSGAEVVPLGSGAHYAFHITRSRGNMAAQPEHLLLLVNKREVDLAARRSALFPLITGMATLGLVATTMLWMMNRIVRRLTRVSERVARIASGDFDVRLADSKQDEVGQVANSVDWMATQLKQLWQEINKRQGEKLLVQVASGLAHQLRNTLTGAKMALELHAQSIDRENEEVAVALQQLATAEDYICRLLVVGTGQLAEDQAARVGDCLETVRAGTGSIARHLKVQLDFELEPRVSEFAVRDGRSFSAAVTNLVMNALQAGSHVHVHIISQELSADPATQSSASNIVVTVIDDGPGIAADIQDGLFEPFVTTKPEGMGLGLSVVQRAADHLDGRVEWSRESARTIFRFQCPAAESAH